MTHPLVAATQRGSARESGISEDRIPAYLDARAKGLNHSEAKVKAERGNP